MEGYPQFQVKEIINEFYGKRPVDVSFPKLSAVKVNFPTRLNIMVLDQTKIAPNERMIFPAGEVLVSIKLFIHVRVEYLGDNEGRIIVGDGVRRKVLAYRAYYLMSHILGVTPSLRIDVDDSDVMTHSGLGSSGATLGAVCAAINELFGNPIDRLDLAEFLSANYGEEISNDNIEMLQCMPSFGGSFVSGLFEGAVQVVAGQSVPIMSGDYSGFAVIGIPLDYVPGTAALEVERHGKYLFENPLLSADAPVINTAYNANVAYHMLNEAMPLLRKGDISGICKMSFDMNFNIQSHGVTDYDWFFPRSNEIAENIRYLYEDGLCDGLGKSSTGPAFFAIVKNEDQYDAVKKAFLGQNMKVIRVDVCAETYRAEIS